MPFPLPQLARVLGRLVMKTCDEGAQTSVLCCTAPDVVPGGYYADCKLAAREARWATSKRGLKEGWDTTQQTLDELAPWSVTPASTR